MRRDPRKQPWQTFPFWFLILSGLAMTVAWKLDLLRPQAQKVATEEATATEESAPDWAAETQPGTAAVDDSAVAADDAQGEPVIAEKSPRSFPAETPADDAATAPAQSEPAATATTETAQPESAPPSSPFSRTNARLVSAERKQPRLPEAPKANSLSSIVSGTKSSKSPFGPARVEFQGTRKGKTASPPAESAALAPQTAATNTESEKIVQTAAIDAGSTRPDWTEGQKPAKPAPASASPDHTSASDDAFDFTAIDQLIAQGEDVEANFQLSNLYWKQPEIRKQLAERLRAVSYRIYFAPQPHYMDGYVVQPGDALQNIAKEYDVSWEYLAKLNRTDPKKIRPGQKLKVIRGPFAAVVDLSDMELTIHSHGHFVHAFPIGIGKDNSTPMGTFKVQEKQRDPTYYGPAGVIANDDPKNPLGEYWLDLGDNYGIHGTIDESLIGKAESNGCIRMKNRDIADVYDLLTSDSEVLIRR